MNRFIIAALTALSAAAIATDAIAQQASSPFDMGSERRDRGIEDAPQQSAPTLPTTQPPAQPSAPVIVTPAPASPPTAAPVAPPAQRAEMPASPAAPVADAADLSRRYLLPFSAMRLNGEIDQRSWSIYLTAEQAGHPAKLHVAYQNAIVVAPETSRLTITINDAVIAAQSIASAEQAAELVFDVPAGLLKAGGNLVRFNTSQRHRTDCTIESTYELWTEVDPARTYLSFEGDQNRRLARLDDLRAVGVDARGNTQFRIIAPALDQMGATETLMRLAQGLSLMGGMPNQSFSFSKQADAPIRPGEVAIFVGTAAELRQSVPAIARAVSDVATASFVDYPGSNGISALVLSGPNWASVDSLVDGIVSSVDGSATQRRDMLATESWRGMDTPFLYSGATLDFSALGVSSQEFSGRLFRTTFSIGVPADFYANAYGEARILLDAAYTADVLPGSHIDVFVNGSIASTLPITSDGGAVLDKLPIKLTMRHFRPGVNTITIEAAMRTAADAVCAPGATAEDRPRFAMFGTSQFHMPDFARIAQVPNIAATTGVGFPYAAGQEPVSLFLGRIDEPTLSATATFLGKIASASYRVMPFNVTISAARIAERNAIFVGGISEIPANILTQLKVDQDSRNSWSPDTAAHNVVTPPGISLQDWQQRADSNFIARQFSQLSEWAKDNFDLSLSTLRFAPSTGDLYSPPRTANLVVAQESDPSGQGTWTAIMAPDSAALDTGMREISVQDKWEELAGRISIYSGPEENMAALPVSWFRFVPTQEISFSNARLIAANWLSDNIMSYALLLAAGSVLLGLATGALLSLLGRRG